MVKKLRSAKGMVDLDFLFSALTAWLEKQRIEAILTNDRARDTFRKRSSVMGFRAVLAISPFYDLTDVDVQQKLTDFAIYIVDKVLSSQLIFVGDKLNKLADSADTPRQQSRLFDLLPDEFTTEQISLLLMQERIKTPARQILYRCRTNAFVEEVHKGQYKKIKCQNKLREQLYEKED